MVLYVVLNGAGWDNVCTGVTWNDFFTSEDWDLFTDVAWDVVAWSGDCTNVTNAGWDVCPGVACDDFCTSLDWSAVSTSVARGKGCIGFGWDI